MRISWLDSSGTYLEVKLHPIYLKLKDGTKQRIDIMPADLDTFKLTLDNSFDLLSSVPFQIPTDAEEIVFDYTVSAEGMDKVLSSKTDNLEPVFNLVNSDNQILANSNRSHLLASNNLKEVRQQVTIPLNGISSTKLSRAEIKLNGLIPKKETFASLGHIFDFTNLENKDGEGKLAIGGTRAFKELTVQNYPNPFNPVTSIQYQIPQDGLVTLRVYDILGREITTLVNEEKPAGVYAVAFDASLLSSGIYFYRIESGGKFLTRKMMVIK